MQLLCKKWNEKLINIIQDKDWLILTKGKGKSPLFCGNGERVITINILNEAENISEQQTSFKGGGGKDNICEV